MPSFRIENLPEKTLIMHKTQARWRKKNWEDSLKNHGTDLEELLSIIDLFDFWKNHLPRNDATKYLSKEIYTDAYFSIHLACFGLYKNAYMSLRSQLETTLRLIYFSNHLLEFTWWQNGKEKWIGDLLKGSDVWGQNFKYFTHIPEIEKLEEISSPEHRLIKGNSPKLKIIYSELSKYVHSVGPFLQTRHGRLSTKYSQNDFKSWYKMFRNVHKYINILLVLCFPEQFKKMLPHEIDQILDLAIGDDYKDLVKEACNL